MKKIKIALFLFFCFTALHSLICQTQKELQYDIKNVVPPSPEVASLGQYGQIPVSMHTGTPEISIPLYSLKGQDLSMPIYLSYHGGGFKVSEVASSVGLGWTLNAGGVIGRTVNGWPDEYSNIGYYDFGHVYNDQIKGTQLAYTDKTEGSCPWRFKMINGEVDLEPDDFYFNFGNYSGRIIFNEAREPIFSPHQDLKIEGSVLGTWKITTPDGTKYYFEKIERTSFRYGGYYISAWYLTKVESVKTDEIISFQYKDNGRQWNVEQRKFPSIISLLPKIDPISGQRYCSSSLLITETESTPTTQLHQIQFPKAGIVISLDYAEDRQDIAMSQTQQRLVKLSVFKVNPVFSLFNDTICSFNLQHNYFEGKKRTGDSDYEIKRLKLLSLTNNTNHTKYLFEYEENHQMPSYTSPDIDHWGYYNNSNNNGIIPPLPRSYQDIYWNTGSSSNSNRETDQEAVKACMLKKIIYPTGGYSEFTWEANNVSYENEKNVVEKSCHITCQSGDINMNEIESGFARYLEGLYIDDTNMPINLKMSGFIKRVYSYDMISLSNNTGNTMGYRKTYLYKYSESTDSDIENPRHFLFFNIMNNNQNMEVYNGQSLYLSPGTYFLITIISKKSTQSPLVASINYEDEEIIKYKDQLVGGVRIKKLLSHDGINHANDIVKTYSYKKDYLKKAKEDEPPTYSRSSGELFSDPFHSYYHYYYVDPCSKNMILTSFLVDEIGNPLRDKGTHIGYAEVTEQTTGNQGGVKTVLYENSHVPERRSLVVAEKVYDKDLNPKMITNYDYLAYYLQSSYKLYATRLTKSIVYCKVMGCRYEIVFDDIAPTSYTASWPGLKETKIRTYDSRDTCKYMEDITQYDYQGCTNGKHIMPTQKTHMASDGSKTIEKIRYPMDFDSSDNIIKTLQNQNFIHEPIEKQVYKDSKLISSYYFGYQWTGRIITLSGIFEWDFSKSQNYAYGIDNSGNLYPNTSYRKMLSYETDNVSGSILTQTKMDNLSTAYIWCHYKSQLAVKIDNLTAQEIPADIKAAIENHTFSAGKNINDIRQDIIFLTNQLAQLHAGKPFLITLYTYNFAGNLASITDPTGKTIYYEYDSFNRLQYIKDHNGKIIETYNYHYQNQ